MNTASACSIDPLCKNHKYKRDSITAEFIKLSPDTLRQLSTVDERLVSYNVEMTEVTGGTFWKAYFPEEIAGTKPFEGPVGSLANHTAMAALMQFYPPIDLKSEKLRKLAKDIGPAWVRVSGTWSTKTYYDFDGKMGGKSPEGYQNVLTRDQWLGVLDFCRDIGAKLMISVANCAGLHSADEPWNPSQAEQIFALSKEYGVPIDAAEFMNEPNMLAMSGDTWASTYLDVLRTLNELGGFSAVTDGIIFHNTLASSDYGYLKPEVFDPRPNFFAVVLWNRLMGTTVYDAAEPIREGAHVYAHSRRDGKPGKAYLVINNSMTETTTVELPGKAEIYQLTAETPRASVMQCNGKALPLGEGYALPATDPVAAEGTLTLPALSCTFIVTEG